MCLDQEKLQARVFWSEFTPLHQNKSNINIYHGEKINTTDV